MNTCSNTKVKMGSCRCWENCMVAWGFQGDIVKNIQTRKWQCCLRLRGFGAATAGLHQQVRRSKCGIAHEAIHGSFDSPSWCTLMKNLNMKFLNINGFINKKYMLIYSFIQVLTYVKHQPATFFSNIFVAALLFLPMYLPETVSASFASLLLIWSAFISFLS